MSAKHTKGPWTLDTDGEMLFVLAGDTVIARIMADKTEYDARLIAAAPELLEALEWLLEYKGHVAINSVGDVRLQGKLMKAIEQAHAVIAKVKS